MRNQHFVIVGASLAGGSAAAALREGGFEGEITLIGAETQLPYNGPPLSKGYLRGQDRLEDQFVNPAAYYAEHGIDLRLGVRASAIDPTRKVVALEGGEEVSYDRLLMATGGRNRPLTTPGGNLPGIFQLRTVEDCDRIRASAKPGRRAVVVGLGFIGSEVAASLRQMGLEVSAVEGHPVPLARIFGPEVGAVLAEIHREKGVELVLGDAVAAFEGADRVQRVRTRKRRVLECDLVVPGSASCPIPSCWRRRGRRWTTASSWTNTAGRHSRTSTRPATWPIISTRSLAACASSTGTTGIGRDAPRAGRCSAAPSPMTTSTRSGRISTSM
jgi:3-phenylpropionate/trans-cinnamate dioxygenase ferredoxin reductase subunit